MGKAIEDDVFSCADARRALLRVMREEQAVSDVIGRLVSPWDLISAPGHEEGAGDAY